MNKLLSIAHIVFIFPMSLFFIMLYLVSFNWSAPMSVESVEQYGYKVARHVYWLSSFFWILILALLYCFFH